MSSIPGSAGVSTAGESFALARVGVARIADAAGIVLLAWLLLQVMFGASQPFEQRALWIGGLAVIACLADPTVAKIAPWPMLLYVASGVLSAAVQGWPTLAPGSWSSWMAMVNPAMYLVVMALFVYGAGYTMRTPGRLAAFTVLFVGCASVLAVQILFDRVSANYFFIRAGSTSLPSVVQWAGLHQTGLVLMLAFPLVFAPVIVTTGWTVRLGSFVLGAGLLTVAYLNASRSGLMVMVLVAILMVVIQALRRIASVRVRAVIAITALVLAAAFVAILVTRTVALRPSGSFTGERGPIWQAAGSIFMDHFWTGAGPGSFFRTMIGQGYAERYLPLYPEVGAGVEQAHNLFLQAAAEMGIFGLVTLTIFLAWLIRGSWRAWIRRGSVIACGIAFVLLAFTMRSMLDNFLDLPLTADRIRVLVWIVFAAALALQYAPRAEAAQLP